MLCEQCQKREAKVHITSTVQGSSIQSHLCQECFNKHSQPVQWINTIQNSLCRYCGGRAITGGIDGLAAACEEYNLIYLCEYCSVELSKYSLPILQRIRGDIENHMREWVTRKG